jgi:Flp pilus assembly protein TadG
VADRAAGRRGSAAIEFAIVLPVLLMFVLGLLDCGRLLWTYTTLTYAVEAAARCGAINTITCVTSSNMEVYAATQDWGLGASPIFKATLPPLSSCGIQVLGTLSFTFIIPWFYGGGPSSNTLLLSSTACYPT